MASIIFNNWKGGLDLRRTKADGPANILWGLVNAYVSTGFSIKKRPCLTKVATLETGTTGLKAAAGVLNTFYESGTISHANPLFVARKLAHPTVSQPITAVHFAETFNAYLYAAVEYADGSIHHFYNGARVTDVNCPNGKYVKKLASKIFGNSSGNVRYCKTDDPTDWTTAKDAGFIAASNYAAGSSIVTGLAEYTKRLVVFFSDSLQTWTADPDPSNISLEATSPSGTTHSTSAAPIASDLAFLAKQGFRTASLTVMTANNLQENDVGSPIDALRGDIADADSVIGIFYPALGQMWWIVGSTVYVYSYSRSVKLSAWSTYTLPISVDAAAVLNSELYLRSGDSVYRVDSSVYTDDGVAPLVTVEMYHQDCKLSGVFKTFSGFDCVLKGTAEIQWEFKSSTDPSDPVMVTDAVTVSSDTRPEGLYPMEIGAVSVAPKITHQANEMFELFKIQPYYDPVGVL